MSKLKEIDPAKIITEEELQNILSSIGYKSQSAPFKNHKVIRENSTNDFSDEPCVWLIGQENNLDSHCIVTIENKTLHVYCYDDHNDIYRVWDKFSKSISIENFINVINLATNIELVMKKLNYS